MKSPVDILYKEADDAHRLWIESVNVYYKKGGTKYLKQFFDEYITFSKSLVEEILSKLPKKPKTAIDIGAGYGGVAINLALKGINVIAIEPGNLDRKVMRYYLSLHPKAKNKLKVVDGVGEKIPIENSSTDLCILSQVLEHVNSPDDTMREVSRVLKKGGYCHLSSPNYLFPVEQHYHLPYFPFMSKALFSKWALLLLKQFNVSRVKDINARDGSLIEHFIDDINYTNDFLIKRLCKKHKLRIVWSLSEKEKSLFSQLKAHWRQDPSFRQMLLVFISLPKKIARVALANIGILPMKLEYLIIKT